MITYKKYIILALTCLLAACSNSENEVKKPEIEQEKSSPAPVVTVDPEMQKAAIENTEKNQSEMEKPQILTGYRLKSDDIYWGNTSSKVTLIEYFSPTCPHCVYYHSKILPEIRKKYIDTGKILYISREFISNKQDFDATILARCQGNRESYASFMDIFLKQQSKWAFNKNYREMLTNIGMLGGVSPERFAECLNDKEISNSIIENTKLIAQERGFIGTPAFIINGKFHQKSYSVKDLSEAIDKLLSESNDKKEEI